MKILKASVMQENLCKRVKCKVTLLFYNECCQISGIKYTFQSSSEKNTPVSSVIINKQTMGTRPLSHLPLCALQQ